MPSHQIAKPSHSTYGLQGGDGPSRPVMITVTVLALLPIVIVVGITTRELRILRQLRHRCVLHKTPLPEVDVNAQVDLGAVTEAYAAYLNAPRGVLDAAEQQMFDEDLAKARAAVETAWLQAKPVRQPN
jgi:hypothetical protein